MKRSDTVIVSAIAGVLALAAVNAVQAKDQPAATEKCYGISKAGKNDCATATSACQGTSKKDADKSAWLGVPKGTCEKIVGASLKPSK